MACQKADVSRRLAMQDRFIVESGLARAISDLVEPVLADLGFRLVRVDVTGRDGKTVQVMAERPDGTMTIDDCESVSRQISPLLDVHDPIAGAYRLEVSSPGIDRPLVRLQDFETWAGHEAKVELKQPVEGQKRFRGRIEGVEDGEIRLETELAGHGVEVIGLSAAEVASARLVLTDELVREALSRAKKQSKGSPSDGSDASALGLEGEQE